VWEHTIETFRYRKTEDPALSLSLLLHDSGKPSAKRNEGREFDRHSQIGADVARKFLSRVGFERKIIEDVGFLVKEHMLPAALPDLPFFRIGEIMANPLFPKLLEVYRCDVSSTFRGPEGYYKACKVYQSFLRNRKNPFRNSGGKKIARIYIES